MFHYLLKYFLVRCFYDKFNINANAQWLLKVEKQSILLKLKESPYFLAYTLESLNASLRACNQKAY